MCVCVCVRVFMSRVDYTFVPFCGPAQELKDEGAGGVNALSLFRRFRLDIYMQSFVLSSRSLICVRVRVCVCVCA